MLLQDRAADEAAIRAYSWTAQPVVGALVEGGVALNVVRPADAFHKPGEQMLAAVAPSSTALSRGLLPPGFNSVPEFIGHNAEFRRILAQPFFLGPEAGNPLPGIIRVPVFACSIPKNLPYIEGIIEYAEQAAAISLYRVGRPPPRFLPLLRAEGLADVL